MQKIYTRVNCGLDACLSVSARHYMTLHAYHYGLCMPMSESRHETFNTEVTGTISFPLRTIPRQFYISLDFV